METRTPHWRRLILPVGFALACVLLTLLTFRSFGGSLPLAPQGYRFDVPLPQASNLFPGSGVQIAGVEIGEILEVRRDGDEAVATVELEARFAPLGSRARAILRTKTLLGEGYLEIAPGAASAPPILDGGRLARGQVRPAIQLDEVLETFTPATRERTRRLFTGLSRALDGRAEALSDSLGHAAPLAGNLSSVIDTLEGQKVELGRLFAGSAGVLDALGERQGVLQAAVTAGDDVLEVTARRNRELAAAVRALPPFLDQLRATSRTVTRASGDLNGAVQALLPVAPLVRPTLTEIRAAAPEFRGLFRELPATIAAGDRGLPSLTRILRAAPRTLRQLYPASRELLPFMRLFAVNRNATYSTFVNVASVLNGTMIAPGGLVKHYGTGIATVWNETLSGWVKKLPSNRQNPYPKPDSLVDISRIGQLKAYDCRNTGNPERLPPTGTGSPPCLLQGPWELNGKSRFYPRLELAPP